MPRIRPGKRKTGTGRATLEHAHWRNALLPSFIDFLGIIVVSSSGSSQAYIPVLTSVFLAHNKLTNPAEATPINYKNVPVSIFSIAGGILTFDTPFFSSKGIDTEVPTAIQ